MLANTRITILGAGWLGSFLADYFSKLAYPIKVSSRSPAKLEEYLTKGFETHHFDLAENYIDDNSLFNAEIIIICIAGKLNEETNEKYWLDKFGQLFQKLKAINPRKVFLMSSIGVIPDLENNFTEKDAVSLNLNKSFSLCAEEALLNLYPWPAFIFRLGGLIGPGRDLAKHFAGKSAIPNGLNPVNLIHVKDICGILQWAMENEYNHPITHLVNPEHPTREKYYTDLCFKLGFDQPHFISEKKQWKQVNSAFLKDFYSFQVNLDNISKKDFII
ncbi:MAG: hypothetical protein EOO99_05900 [Pedobacter sp.]|nr:MAG: hypothetical protein EOO99_05900 [Pedobacter sp.]